MLTSPKQRLLWQISNSNTGPRKGASRCIYFLCPDCTACLVRLSKDTKAPRWTIGSCKAQSSLVRRPPWSHQSHCSRRADQHVCQNCKLDVDVHIPMSRKNLRYQRCNTLPGRICKSACIFLGNLRIRGHSHSTLGALPSAADQGVSVSAVVAR